MLRNSFAFLIVAALATSASGATVTYDMNVAGNNFEITLAASAGDNFGIAGYSIPLLGDITLDHVTPMTPFGTGAGGNGPRGFSFLRSPNTALNAVGAAQDTTAATPTLIRGFGQQAGSFAGLGITPVGGVTGRDPWTAPLVIATGTFTGDAPAIDVANIDFGVNIFTEATGIAAAAATLVQDGGGTAVPPVAVDLILGDRIRGADIAHTFTTSAGTPPITWGGLVATGPGGAAPATAPVLNADGTFTWESHNSAFGLWTFDATADNTAAGAGGGTDVGRLSVNLIVPEPATMSLLGLAMVGLVGLFGRRAR